MIADMEAVSHDCLVNKGKSITPKLNTKTYVYCERFRLNFPSRTTVYGSYFPLCCYSQRFNGSLLYVLCLVVLCLLPTLTRQVTDLQENTQSILVGPEG